MAARNAPCPCGSGKKYKHCCALKDSRARSQRSVWTGVLVALVLLGGLLIAGIAFTSNDDARSDGSTNGRVWSEEHGHWHDAP